MYDIIRDWYARNFSDPQAVILAFFLLVVFGLVWLVGDIMAPVLVSLVLAYLLEGLVAVMMRFRVHRTVAAAFVLLLIVAISAIVLFGLIPVMSQQLTDVMRELPGMFQNIQEQLLRLPESYPDIFTIAQVNELIDNLRREITSFTQAVLSFSLARLGTLVMIAVYVVLVPIMVFFALKDKEKLLSFARKFVPSRSELTFKVWRTVPIALIGFIQWGFVPKLGYMLIAYQIIQILDGNVLVPLLFSEVVNLHPLAIITAVLFFGGLFGLWGVFFAIPLATLVQAVLNAWPKARENLPQRA